MTDRPRILLVDDEATILLVLAAMLTRAGYSVETADGGAAAIERLQREPIDLLLVDMRMPMISGDEVVAVARECQPDIAIIVLTGFSTLDAAVAEIRPRIFDHLQKSTDPATVLARVRAGLAAHANPQRRAELLAMIGEDPAAPGQAGADGPMLTLGNLQINTRRQTATLYGVPLALTPTELRVLCRLTEHAGTAQSAVQLARAVFGYEVGERDADRLIRPHIQQLRLKLESAPNQPCPMSILMEDVGDTGFRITASAE
jgi:DNA-binding response OmpR family regulator